MLCKKMLSCEQGTGLAVEVSSRGEKSQLADQNKFKLIYV
jgi:hypothetical protein